VKAIIVYESMWGNTAAIARAIAEGMGPEAMALNTSQATSETVADADLIVGGAPLMGFMLPTQSTRDTLATSKQHRDNPPDLSNPSMRSWFKTLSRGSGHGAGFETGLNWSPGSAAKKITRKLASAGYETVVEPERFLVTGTYGPLKDGEIERAKAWGAAIAEKVKAAAG